MTFEIDSTPPALITGNSFDMGVTYPVDLGTEQGDIKYPVLSVDFKDLGVKLAFDRAAVIKILDMVNRKWNILFPDDKKPPNVRGIY